jgi:hypothetical protein
MAAPAKLPRYETATAGDPHVLTVKIADQAAADATWLAELRVTRGGTLVETYAVDASDGSGDDAGKAILVLTLTGAETEALGVGTYHGEMQQTDVAPGSEPRTLLRWYLRVEPDSAG